MNTREVVPSKMQSYCRFEIFQLLRECIRESGESPKLHANRQVLPSDMGRRNQA